MKTNIILLFFVMSIFSTNAFSDDLPDVIEVDAKIVYTPMGFDNNDVSQFVIEGEFPSSCYRLNRVKLFGVDENKIGFRVYAYRYRAPCLKVMTPFMKVVDVGILEEGQYPIWNLKDKSRLMGTLNIQEASSPKRDEFDYAPVDTALIYHKLNPGYNETTRELLIYGVFPSNCLEFIDERLPIKQTNSNVIEVLPIMRKNDNFCTNTPVPFKKRIAIPDTIPQGKYLIHIRTMNGTSFNKIEYLKPAKKVWGRP